MPDTKITALAAITTVDPAADVLPIVDISDTSMAASGTTKKITSNQILGAGGTATLASATITGDLTVDTSTLKVDSANNRVGIGTASPAVLFHAALPAATFGEVGRFYDSSGNGISFTANANSGFNQITSTGAQPLIVNVNSSERYRIASDGVATWSNVGGVAGTAMTLNSTGLGVGVSPTGKLSLVGTGTYMLTINNTATDARIQLNSAGTEYGQISVGTDVINLVATGANTNMRFLTNGSEKMRLDPSGNVGIGVAPSYKLDTYTTLQGTVTAKQFANRTSNKILVKRFFGITADTTLFSVECGTAGAGAMAAFEINVFATGQKSGVSSDRQFYGKWYVTRNLAGTFTITSAFSSGSSGAFTVAASGTSLNVNGIFSVISDGSACVEVTGYIGGRDTVIETALNVTMP